MTTSETTRARIARLTGDVIEATVRAVHREDRMPVDDASLADLRRTAARRFEVRVDATLAESVTDAELREELRAQIEPALRRVMAPGRPS